MIIFAHRGKGFGKKENSLEAVSEAISRGFSVEIDLRMKGKGIVLSHDKAQRSISGREFDELLGLIKANSGIFFALHLKEKSGVFFEKISGAVQGIKNLFLFVTDFPQRRFILKMSEALSKSNLALYVTTNKDLESDLINKVEYFWLDESQEKIYNNLCYFNSLRKKIICCSPELFCKEKKRNLANFSGILNRRGNELFGICTDYGAVYQNNLEKGLFH